CAEFDHVSTIFHLVSNSLTEPVRAVGDSLGGSELPGQEIMAQAGQVGMPAARAETIDSDKHARPGHEAADDGIPQTDVDQVFASDIPNRSEAGFQHFSRVDGRGNRPLCELTAKLIDKRLLPVVSVF